MFCFILAAEQEENYSPCAHELVPLRLRTNARSNVSLAFNLYGTLIREVRNSAGLRAGLTAGTKALHSPVLSRWRTRASSMI
jgi:hypothetical protein